MAKLDFSFLRIFRKIVVEVQRSWIFPSSLRCKFLRLGGVRISQSFVGRDVTFDTLRPDLVKIGHSCVITSGAKILTHFYSTDEHKMFLGSVNIGNYVFIGMNVIIANSVTIGDHSVIGAGAVVTKDIPSGEVWGGYLPNLLRR